MALYHSFRDKLTITGMWDMLHKWLHCHSPNISWSWQFPSPTPFYGLCCCDILSICMLTTVTRSFHTVLENVFSRSTTVAGLKSHTNLGKDYIPHWNVKMYTSLETPYQDDIMIWKCSFWELCSYVSMLLTLKLDQLICAAAIGDVMMRW